MDADVRIDAAGLCLLSGAGAAALAAICVLVAAADLCVRGDAGAFDRQRVPGRPDAGGIFDECGPAGGLICGIPCPFEERSPAWLAADRRRIGHFPVDLRALHW